MSLRNRYPGKCGICGALVEGNGGIVISIPAQHRVAGKAGRPLENTLRCDGCVSVHGEAFMTAAEISSVKGDVIDVPSVSVTASVPALVPAVSGAVNVAPSADGIAAAISAAIAAALAGSQKPTVDMVEIERVIDERVMTALETLTLPRPLDVQINGLSVGTMPAERHFMTEQALSWVALGIPVYLVGPAGGGKTSAAKQIFAALGLAMRVQGPVSGSHEFLGYKDGYGQYHDTATHDAWLNGHGLLIDEIDGSADGSALLPVNQLLESNGAEIGFPDKPTPTPRHPNFRVIVTANTYGTGSDRVYVGRCQLDGSTLDRFAQLSWPYDEAMEARQCANGDWVRYVQKARRAVEALELRHIVSPRCTFMGATALAAGIPQAAVESALLWRGLSSAEKARVVSQMGG